MAQDDRGAETDERRADRALGLFWGDFKTPIYSPNLLVNSIQHLFVAI